METLEQFKDPAFYNNRKKYDSHWGIKILVGVLF